MYVLTYPLKLVLNSYKNILERKKLTRRGNGKKGKVRDKMEEWKESVE